MAGFLAAAGLIGGAASAAGHGLADSHKRAGDVGGADVVFQVATADKVSGFKRVIDEQDWTITKVAHFLNNSGFTTSLELEVRLSDVEYETEDDE